MLNFIECGAKLGQIPKFYSIEPAKSKFKLVQIMDTLRAFATPKARTAQPIIQEEKGSSPDDRFMDKRKASTPRSKQQSCCPRPIGKICRSVPNNPSLNEVSDKGATGMEEVFPEPHLHNPTTFTSPPACYTPLVNPSSYPNHHQPWRRTPLTLNESNICSS